MASYTRLGSYLLASELTADPSGKIYRAITLAGGAFERHHLVRSFSEELFDAGLGAKLGEAQRVAGLLAGSRSFGSNYLIEAGKSGHVSCDYVPGRSLAQMLEKTREEQIPLGVDHALSVLQGMAQALIHMHGKGVHHGTLSPHSVWVSFEGGTELLDAPYAAILQGLLPKCRTLEAALAPYAPGVPASPLQQDLFALGAVFFELLTLERLPAAAGIPQALAAATLKAAQEEGGIPTEIQNLLRRLLMVGQPFADVHAFNEDLEKVLYDGEYSPTTFNMAFFMHTLFREQNEQDIQAMKTDQGADFTPFLPAEPGTRSMLEKADGTSLGKYLAIGAGVLILLFGFMLYRSHQAGKENQALQAKIAELQRDKAQNDGKLADLSKQEDAQKLLQEQLTKKASEAKTVEERAKAKKDLEEARQKSDDLARQRGEALRKQQELSTTIAQAAPAPAPAPAPKPEPPKVEPPKEAAKPAAQAVAIPAPAPAQPAPVQQSAAADVVDQPPTITKRVVPVVPRIANKSFLPPSVRDSEIRVNLKVFVDAQGRPLKVMIGKGVDGPFAYNDNAQKAALESTYTPGTRNGKPVAAWLPVDYVFPRPK